MGTTSKIVLILSLLTGCGEQAQTNKSVKLVKDKVVPASCGLCKFGLPNTKCELAVKIDEEAYFVEGVDTGDHDSFHEPEGYCMMTRKARVSGVVKNKKFIASSYELLPVENKD